MSLRIAAAQYAIGEPRSFDDFAARVAASVARIAQAGASVVVLPEYLSLEVAAAQPVEIRSDFLRSLAALQAHRADYEAMTRALARRHGVYLVAGTFLVDTGGGRYRNRALLASPDGGLVYQDKLTLTGFERAAGVIEPGDELKVFDADFGRVAINVCYDIEFPLYARAQAEAGARLILCPSCTDTAAGASRVRIGAQARALENQCYVAVAVTAGEAPWSPALDVNTGHAALYTPVDRGFPADGIAAMAAADAPLVMADVDLAALDAQRREGQVSNADDWPAQARPRVVRASVERL